MGCRSLSLLRCKSCNTVYLADRYESFDNSLYDYYEKFRNLPKNSVFDSLTASSYLKVLDLLAVNTAGKTIIDVGCGMGGFVDISLANGWQAEGLELAVAAVEIAQSFGLPVRRIDFLSGMVKNDSADIVTMFEVIEHLVEPATFLKRAEMVVRPGGLVYLTTPNFNSMDRRILGKKWRVFHREHLTYFTPSTLLSMIHHNTDLEVLHFETRNLSNELVQYFKGMTRMVFSGHGGSIAARTSEASVQADLRTAIERSHWLSLVKRVINSLLDATSLGSTVVMLLRRPVK